MKKILIVDDDADMRDVLSAILEGKYEFKEACSKKEGLEILKDYDPDLIILDVMMEEINSGFDMARELKQSEKSRDVKLLMVTNVDNEMKINFKDEAGDNDWLPVDDYIIKPIDPESFLQKVEDFI